MTGLPLSRFKVLDLTLHRAGPTCARQLADWGADVLKIEAPGGAKGDSIASDRDSADYINTHRNKRSMTLNLKDPEGRDIFLRLADEADVIVENFRSDVKQRLRIDYQAVAARNPRIVYASLSGFGQTGPDANRPGVDMIAQGMSGLMSITGAPGHGPMRVGIPLADTSAGLFLFQAILLALLQRDAPGPDQGRGQWVQTSLLEAQMFMLDFQAARWLVSQEVPGQTGNDHPTSIPTGVFPTADGEINIAASGDAMWHRFCQAIDAPDLLNHPEHASNALRSQNRSALNARVAAITRTKPSAAWETMLNAAGVPCGAINDIERAFAEPQVRHVKLAKPMRHTVLGDIAVLGQPMHLSAAEDAMEYRPPAALGADTDQVLNGLGYDAAGIATLRDRGVV